MHLRQPTALGKPGFTNSAYRPFTKNKERTQKFKKQEIQDTFIKRNWIKVAFNMICLMEILSTCLEEQLLIKYYMIKHLIWLKYKI